jgi:hypothetical protein
MCQTVGFASSSINGQGKDRARFDKVRTYSALQRLERAHRASAALVRARDRCRP